MLVHTDYESSNDKGSEHHVVLPPRLTALHITYDHGRFSLGVNGRTLYQTIVGTNDFEIRVDNAEPSPDFLAKNVGITIDCDGDENGDCDSPPETPQWIQRGAFNLYTRSGTRMALVTCVCPYCNAEHIGRVFTDSDYNVTRIENDDGTPSSVMSPLDVKPTPKPDKPTPQLRKLAKALDNPKGVAVVRKSSRKQKNKKGGKHA